MKRIAVIIAVSLAMIGTATANAKPPIQGYVEDGSSSCGPWYSTWTTHYVWFDGTYYRIHHVRYACFPWGVEVLDQWDT